MTQTLIPAAFPTGAVIFRQGDPGRSAYLVVTGSVEVLAETDGDPLVLAVIPAGEVVGEMALIDPAPRSATVRAAEPTGCVEITPEILDNAITNADPLIRSLLLALVRRLRDADRLQAQPAAIKAAPAAPKSLAQAHPMMAPVLAFILGRNKRVNSILTAAINEAGGVADVATSARDALSAKGPLSRYDVIICQFYSEDMQASMFLSLSAGKRGGTPVWLIVPPELAQAASQFRAPEVALVIHEPVELAFIKEKFGQLQAAKTRK